MIQEDIFEIYRIKYLTKFDLYIAIVLIVYKDIV